MERLFWAARAIMRASQPAARIHASAALLSAKSFDPPLAMTGMDTAAAAAAIAAVCTGSRDR